MNILILDIGGTGMQWSIYNSQSNKMQEKHNFSTRNVEKETLLKKIATIVLSENIELISVASPGAIINKTFVSGLTGIKNYSNFDFKKEINNLIKPKNVEVLLINDANAALMSEIDDTNKEKDIALISIGTGIGGSLFLNGKLREGKRGLAGEFGYQIFDEEKNISLASSSRSIETEYIRKYKNHLTCKEIFNEYKENNLYKDIIEQAVLNNAINIFNLFYSLDIDLFIISGGISKEQEFINQIRNKVQTLSQTRGSGAIINIDIAKNKDNSGLTGALKYALSILDGNK